MYTETTKKKNNALSERPKIVGFVASSVAVRNSRIRAQFLPLLVQLILKTEQRSAYWIVNVF